MIIRGMSVLLEDLRRDIVSMAERLDEVRVSL